MANIKVLSNFLHQGIVFKQGMVVSDNATSPDTAAQNLTGVIPNLIERGLVEATTDPETHSAFLVNGAQEPLPKDASTADGQAPNADQDAAAKARLRDQQVAADTQTQQAVNQQADIEAKPKIVAAPDASVKEAGPTNAEIAASVANQ